MTVESKPRIFIVFMLAGLVPVFSLISAWYLYHSEDAGFYLYYLVPATGFFGGIFLLVHVSLRMHYISVVDDVLIFKNLYGKEASFVRARIRVIRLKTEKSRNGAEWDILEVESIDGEKWKISEFYQKNYSEMRTILHKKFGMIIQE